MTWTQEMRDKAKATREARRTIITPMEEEAKPLPSYWHKAPLDDAIVRLGELKREYDKAAQIVLSRQSESKPRWTCWTQLHKDIVPKSVQSLCRKSGDDGKWASRDDGAFEMKNGIKVPSPVFCCSAICHEYYLKSKPMNSLSRH